MQIPLNGDSIAEAKTEEKKKSVKEIASVTNDYFGGRW
jgi:hypothetical protein